MSEIALDEEGMGALTRALVDSAAGLERVAAAVRAVGSETGRSTPAGHELDRVAAARRRDVVDVRRRIRAAREEEHRAAPRVRALPACGPEWRTMSRAQVAGANARYRLEALRRAGGSSWGAAGVVGGWVRQGVQRFAAGAAHDAGAVRKLSDWESKTAAHRLAWMDEQGNKTAAALPGPLRPAAKVFGSGLSGLARGTVGGATGVQAIFATNVDGLGRLGVAASHADVKGVAAAGRGMADADTDYLREAGLGLVQTARVSRRLDPTNPGEYVDLYGDVEEKGLTNALADNARDVGAEVPGAALMLVGDPPTVVGKTAVTVGEAGALKHGDHELDGKKPKDAKGGR